MACFLIILEGQGVHISIPVLGTDYLYHSLRLLCPIISIHYYSNRDEIFKTIEYDMSPIEFHILQYKLKEK